MIYLIAILFPPLALLLCGKPFQAFLSFLLCCTIVGWVFAALWAMFVAHDGKAQARHNQQMGIAPRNDSAFLAVALVLALVIIPVAFCVVPGLVTKPAQQPITKAPPAVPVVTKPKPAEVPNGSWGERVQPAPPVVVAPVAVAPVKTEPEPPAAVAQPVKPVPVIVAPPKAKLTRDAAADYVRANPGKTLPEIVEALAMTHEASEDTVKAYLGQSTSGVTKRLEGGRLRYYPAE